MTDPVDPRQSRADVLRVPVHEEELTATTRPVARGAVQIETSVREEERTLDVPITEERARVTRRAVDRDATETEADAFHEGVITVPLQTEAVELQKRTHVAEEVEIAKEAVQTTQQVAGTVRREQVEVTDPTSAKPTPR